MDDDILLNGNLDNDNTQNSDVSLRIDDMFNSLSDDISNFNKYISNVTRQRKENDSEYKELQEEREKVNRARLEFENYIKAKNDELKRKEEQIQDYLNNQKQMIMKSEVDFKNNMDNSIKELDLNKKEIEIQRQRFEAEKTQFESYKTLELNRIKHSEEILNAEREQFEKYKEISNQKIDLETRTLEQKCSKLKEIVSQFNLNYNPVSDEEE